MNKNNLKANFFSLAFLVLMAVIPSQASATTTLFEKNDLQIVITPDGFPIIWMNEKKYGVDFTYGSSLVSVCPLLCSLITENGESVSFSTFRVFQVSTYVSVTVYYDANGNIVATSEVNNTPPSPPAWASRSEVGTFNSTEVGNIGGSFTVTPAGSASYSVPIETPPGTAAAQPSVAVSYDSQSGSGTLGLGWSLSASSQITRCPKTIAQDGEASGISYGGISIINGPYIGYSRFCLDGQR